MFIFEDETLHDFSKYDNRMNDGGSEKPFEGDGPYGGGLGGQVCNVALGRRKPDRAAFSDISGEIPLVEVF